MFFCERRHKNYLCLSYYLYFIGVYMNFYTYLYMESCDAATKASFGNQPQHSDRHFWINGKMSQWKHLSKIQPRFLHTSLTCGRYGYDLILWAGHTTCNYTSLIFYNCITCFCLYIVYCVFKKCSLGVKVSVTVKEYESCADRSCLVPCTCLPWQAAGSCCAVRVGTWFAQV